MRHGLALVWLAIVLLASGYLLLRLHDGLNFHTDLMALLPQDQQNPAAQKTNDKVIGSLARHIILMIGDTDRGHARAAAADITRKLAASGAIDIDTNAFSKDRLRQMGAFYFPYREGLLGHSDRQKLSENKGQDVATRAMSQAYGMIGFANAGLLHNDPFLLMPGFFNELPVPASRLTLDDGMLSVESDSITWVMISGLLRDEPFALTTQNKIAAVIDSAIDAQRASYPNLQTLRLGAVFFAKAGAEEAMHETSIIGVASFIGTILLVLFVFRAFSPLLLSLFAITAGIVTAFAASLWIFGELHVGALLFGVSLIGVAVDYSLQYCSEVFSPRPVNSRERLKHVFMAILLGAATTVIGYLTFFLAPFPGLHQIALFSAIGLIGAWLTVVAWFPVLDRSKPARHGHKMLAMAAGFLALWENPNKRRGCFLALAIFIFCGAVGLKQLHVDDDVHHMQSLNSTLVAEQEKITALIGNTIGGQMFTVQGENTELTLEREEQLIDRLRTLVTNGDLAGFQSLAQYVPSVTRQRENRAMVRERLYVPLLAQQTHQLGLEKPPALPDEAQAFLTVPDILKPDSPLSFLSNLTIEDSKDGTTHVVMLDGVKNAPNVAAAAQNLPGVRFIDPAGDFSRLLAKYRNRALDLLVLSAALMAPLLIARYGVKKGLWIMVPPSLAVILAPALRALTGGSFTFFDAMALVLVLSIGVDYAIFCAETSGDRKPVTMLAVAMAATTALMSFGFLALSDVTAVHNFGMTMFYGITIAFLLAPMARLCNKPASRHIIVALMTIFLVGCSAQPTVENEPLPDTVSIAPNVNLKLPKVSELARPVEASQLVTAQYGNQKFVFEVRISADKDHFRMVGLDMMGRKSVSIDWTPSGISYETAPWIPPQLRPENILADMVLIYWPDAVVHKMLANSLAVMVTEPHSRVFLNSADKIAEVDYQPANKNDIWTGRLHYANLARNYQLDVQSAKIEP